MLWEHRAQERYFSKGWRIRRGFLEKVTAEHVHRHPFTVSVSKVSATGKRYSLSRRAYYLPEASFNVTIFGAFAFMSPLWFALTALIISVASQWLSLKKVPLILLASSRRFINVQGAVQTREVFSQRGLLAPQNAYESLVTWGDKQI